MDEILTSLPLTEEEVDDFFSGIEPDKIEILDGAKLTPLNAQTAPEGK